MRARTSGARLAPTTSGLRRRHRSSPSTNQVEPLPASLGSTPAASPSTSRHIGQPGLDGQGGARQVVAARSRRGPLVPGPVDPRRCPPRTAARSSRYSRRSKGRGVTRSPTPSTRARPPTQAERHVGAQPQGDLGVGAPGPAQHRGRVGRAAAEPAAERDPLGHVHRRRPAGPRPPARGRPGSPRGAAVRRPSCPGAAATVMPAPPSSSSSSSARSSVTISASSSW